jgi:hypothetical protein
MSLALALLGRLVKRRSSDGVCPRTAVLAGAASVRVSVSVRFTNCLLCLRRALASRALVPGGHLMLQTLSFRYLMRWG